MFRIFPVEPSNDSECQNQLIKNLSGGLIL